MNQTFDLGHIYKNREEFIVIGLTGRTGAGCSFVSSIFSKESLDNSFPPVEKNDLNNNKRKYKIARNFLEQNWKPFYVLKYSKVLSLIAYNEQLENIEELLDTTLFEFSKNFEISDFEIEKKALLELKKETQFEDIDLQSKTREEDIFTLFEKNQGFLKFHNKFESCLKKVSEKNRILILHNLCNNQRKGGCYHCSPDPDFDGIYSISKIINRIIKGYRKFQKKTDSPCRVIIDSLRNPLEIVFFKERYSAFYTLAINPNEDVRQNKLKNRFKNEFESIIKIDTLEYGTKNKRTDFYKQNVQQCIQKADLHLSFKESESYPFNIEQQIVVFYSLMLHPGIITPSPQERCMQIAYTAKYNSGCISRQVGAVITDENYAIKSVGWNNTPEMQTPCLLRDGEDLVSGKDEKAFSEYEKDKNSGVNIELTSKLENLDKTNLKGHHCSFCFKDLHNSVVEGKNQVHTRSLHAEENAMLQLTKYGGQGIENGILFTTASPCELCSKKAYQLGIKKVFYIDPYPGIAEKQILNCGERNIDLSLFTGAIGKAYHRFYEPFMAYKDEIYIRTGMVVENKVKKLENENIELKRRISELEGKH